jgi:hypothetical protein
MEVYAWLEGCPLQMIGRGPDDAGDEEPWQTGRRKGKTYLIRIACIKSDAPPAMLTSWQLADGHSYMPDSDVSRIDGKCFHTF